jgi:membrane protein required for beta-lactamase induction
MWKSLASAPVRFFALLCVAATSLFLAFMANKLIATLSSPDWCSKALQAERISTERGGGLTSCVDLLTIQLKSLAINSHIVLGVFALCLLVLIVIVIAGGKLSFAASKSGVSANMSREEELKQAALAGADQAIAGAEGERESIAETPPAGPAKFTKPPGEEL